LRNFRTPVPDLASASVLITGGTGSFGTALVRHLMAGDVPKRLILFSRDEQRHDALHHKLRAEFPHSFEHLRFFVGDVRDKDRLELAMRGVDVVVHAAAMKVIPLAEYNPFECIQTNVHGAENVVKAALRAGVKNVIALSTDKAANPINLYGASKLASDKIMIAANNLSGENGAAFSVVRYGNVIGSRGSVLPLFNRLVSEGAKSLPITDPDMTRFWISLDQGVAFVLSCLAMMKGGEIFVPKIPSMRIIDLARTIAPHLPQEIIGIRPGEKIHEVMITEDDARATLDLGDRYVIMPPIVTWSDTHLMARGARRVPSDFRYSSDTNSEWLDTLTMMKFARKVA
jgi:UDP-N-acetylglucosamine 4,6-dehydratase/5-epimerase